MSKPKAIIFKNKLKLKDNDDDSEYDILKQGKNLIRSRLTDMMPYLMTVNQWRSGETVITEDSEIKAIGMVETGKGMIVAILTEWVSIYTVDEII